MTAKKGGRRAFDTSGIRVKSVAERLAEGNRERASADGGGPDAGAAATPQRPKAPIVGKMEQVVARRTDYIKELEGRVAELQAEAASGGDSEAARERLEQIRAQVEELQGEKERLRTTGNLVVDIDAASIRWRDYNREDQSYQDEAFIALRDSIRENGQQRAIEVRALEAPDGEYQYELVAGHRRHQACLELGIAVRSVIVNITDRDVMIWRWRENYERKNLAPIEMARQIQAMLDSGVTKTATELADVLNLSRNHLYRLLRLLEIPEAVIESFPDPRLIQSAWGSEIKQAIQQNPGAAKRMEAAAAQAAETGDAERIYAAVIAAAKGDGPPDSAAPLKARFEPRFEEARVSKGKVKAKLKDTRRGAVIELSPNVSRERVMAIWSKAEELLDSEETGMK